MVLALLPQRFFDTARWHHAAHSVLGLGKTESREEQATFGAVHDSFGDCTGTEQ